MRFSLLFISIVLVSLAFFAYYPQIDLIVAGLFYDEGFFLKDHILATIFYKGLRWLLIGVVLFLLGALIYQVQKKIEFKYLNKKAILFLFTFFLIAPGLVTNTVIKDHSGRERPAHLEQFGSDAQFRPYYDFNGKCEHNCSFISGHAAAAFAFIAFAFVFKSRKAFYLALSFGVIMGMVRVVQGGHFVSDVIFAFIINYILLKVIYYLFYKKDIAFES
jgi:lipid A 4'-phosphatase